MFIRIILVLFLFEPIAFSVQIPQDILNHRTVAVSHDHRWFAFVESLQNQKTSGFCEYVQIEERRVDRLWLYDTKTGRKRLLVAPDFSCDNPKKVIVGIDELAFSLDDKTLYFQTTAWQTSDALHAIEVDGRNLRYLLPSKDFLVIPKGYFAGDLAIDQIRLWVPFDRGGFSWYWAFSSDGKKELGPIGPNLKPFGQENRNADDFA